MQKKSALFLLLFLAAAPVARAQFGTNYIWTDSLANVSTSPVDSLFATEWESVIIWSRGGDMEFKAATKSDTANWASRDFLRIVENQAISFGSGTKLGRFTVKANAGTVTVYFLGLKKVKRYQ